MAFHQNELDKAQSLFEETLACYRTLSAQRSIAITLLRLGHVRRRQGKLTAASHLYSEATVLLLRIGDRLNLIHAIEGWLYMAVCNGELKTAACLGGTVEAWRERLGTPRPPVEAPEYDDQMATVCTTLGRPIFKIAFAEGQEFSLEQALDEAVIKLRDSSGKADVSS